MSLYQTQKLMYQLNRDPTLRERFSADQQAVVATFKLTDEERDAVLKPDIGLLYVMGVNGQILMHYAALHNMAWPDYLAAMKAGVKQHGPVRAGLYRLCEVVDNDGDAGASQ